MSWAASRDGAGSTCPRTLLVFMHLQWLCGTQSSGRCFQGSGACGKSGMRKRRGRREAEQDNEKRKGGKTKGEVGSWCNKNFYNVEMN